MESINRTNRSCSVLIPVEYIWLVTKIISTKEKHFENLYCVDGLCRYQTICFEFYDTH